ncbi:MAG: T9SS type A sorting domain-containing protein [Edaphocola sp.]
MDIPALGFQHLACLRLHHKGVFQIYECHGTTPTIDVASAGTYYVLVTAQNNCQARDTVTIVDGIVPTNSLPATTNVCEGATVLLDAANSGSTYSWQPGGQSTQTITTDTSGIYTVTITSTDKCTTIGTTDVVVRPLPTPSLGGDTVLCYGDSITLDAGNAGSEYLWNIGDTTQTITTTDTGYFEVTTISPYGCELTEGKFIDYRLRPYVEGFNFIPYFFEELGKVKFLPNNPSNVDGYIWDFGDNTPVSNDTAPVHTYESSGQFLVSLTVANSCNGYTTSLPIHVDLPTGIIETAGANQAGIVLYPNPAMGQVSIKCADAGLKLNRIDVYDAMGKLVWTQNVAGTQNPIIYTSSWANGIYQIRLATSRGTESQRLQILR